MVNLWILLLLHSQWQIGGAGRAFLRQAPTRGVVVVGGTHDLRGTGTARRAVINYAKRIQFFQGEMSCNCLKKSWLDVECPIVGAGGEANLVGRAGRRLRSQISNLKSRPARGACAKQSQFRRFGARNAGWPREQSQSERSSGRDLRSRSPDSRPGERRLTLRGSGLKMGTCVMGGRGEGNRDGKDQR